MQRRIEETMSKKKAEEIESGLDQLNWNNYGRVI